MRIKKEYSFSNKREIWRILPTGTGKMVIEERDPVKREAFFNCIVLDSAEKLFTDFQLDEKFWAGIEFIHNDIIYFHKFARPELPQHLGIIAFDINERNILWENKEVSFLFLKGEEIVCYKSLYEGRNYFIIDTADGNIKLDLGNNTETVKELFENAAAADYEGYFFPDIYTGEHQEQVIIEKLKNEKRTAGNINCLELNKVLLFNFHEITGNRRLTNIFRAVDIDSGKIIFEEKLNTEIEAIIPESFFILNNRLFLLKDKSELIVCSLHMN